MAEATVSDRFAQVRGFKVEIDGAGGKEVDTAWESVSSGQLMIEHVETTIGGGTLHTSTPGHKSVDEITLRGAMTAGRKALCTWMNSVASGRDPFRRVTVTPLHLDGSEGPSVVYEKCFPTRYVFPTMRVPDANDQGCGGELKEEMHFVEVS